MVACSALRRRRGRASTSRSFDATKLLRRFSSSPPRDLWSKSSPPRRDRISRPWYPPPPSCSSSAHNGGITMQQCSWSRAQLFVAVEIELQRLGVSTRPSFFVASRHRLLHHGISGPSHLLLAVIGSPGRGIRLRRRARHLLVTEESRCNNGGFETFCTSGPYSFGYLRIDPKTIKSAERSTRINPKVSNPENLTLPYLTPYLDSVGANYRHGANFATGGSCIRPTVACFSQFHLGTQVSQFIHFKTRTLSLYNQTNGKTPFCKGVLARPKDFSKALYTFDIGQNDLAIGFQNMTEEQLKATIPAIIESFTTAIKLLFKEGARFFSIHNTGPTGCLPYLLKSFPATPRDQYGCLKPLNNVAIEFNKQLKQKISELNKELPYSLLTYVDVYSAKSHLITKAKNLG
ncbi:hypothetical protein Bca101_051528 [Brassica carinata]